MEKYESRLSPGVFVWVTFAYRDLIGTDSTKGWVPMYEFQCADGSVGAMDKRSFHEFYKLVDSQ